MLEYLIVIFEYYKTRKSRYLVSNFAISLILAFVALHFPQKAAFDDLAKGLINNSVSALGILVGFSISIFTLLNTASNPNVEEIKRKDTGFKLYKKPVYLFDLLVINMGYIIIFEGLLLIFNLLFPFFFSVSQSVKKTAFFIDVFLLIHVILVNISTTVDFYFIISKKTSN